MRFKQFKAKLLKMKVLFLYAHFHPTSQICANAKVFLERLGQFKTSVDYDLIWVETSPEVPKHLNQSIVKKIVHLPANLGRDFWAWGEALKQTNLEQYDFVLFANKSGYGPNQDRWLEQFVEPFRKFSKLAVSGPIANFRGGWHIQTWAFMLKTSDVKILLAEDKAFGLKRKFWPYAAYDSREIYLSQKFLKEGRSIYCFLKNYPEIYLKTKPDKKLGITKFDPVIFPIAWNKHANLSEEQNLVFIKNPKGK
jgi:hypothetical protein